MSDEPKVFLSRSDYNDILAYYEAELAARDARILSLKAELEARLEGYRATELWEPVLDDYWGYINVERKGTVITVYAGEGVERVVHDTDYISVPLPEGVRLCRRNAP